MHHMQKAKYLSLKKEGIDPKALEAIMLEAGIDPEEVAAFIDEPLPSQDKGNSPKVAKDKPTPKTKEKPKEEDGEVSDSTNSVYEEWKMAKSFDSNNGIVLEKVKMLRDKVKMDAFRAERLNEHAENRLVKYFLKSN